MDGHQNYSDLPLTIVSATTETVTFAVNQVWLDGSICAVATQYPVSTTDTECQREINVRPGEFAIHTAVCDESGQAEIDQLTCRPTRRNYPPVVVVQHGAHRSLVPRPTRNERQALFAPYVRPVDAPDPTKGPLGKAEEEGKRAKLIQ